MELERSQNVPPLVSVAVGVVSTGGPPRVAALLGERVLDVARVPGCPPWLDAGSLDPLLAAGRPVWQECRAWLASLPVGALEPWLLEDAQTHLPFTVADYVDFYSSRHHAENVGAIFRPDAPSLPAAWEHLPIGYHGRAGTVVVSGTPVRRPCGLRLVDGEPVDGPSLRLDLEAEVGFVVGTPSVLGETVPVDAFAEHVFGVVLVNDWSARDLQAFEYVPLGPFLGKSFATSVSAWVMPLDDLQAARCASPPSGTGYLRGAEQWGLDLTLEVSINGAVLSRPPFADMWWTAAQQLAHLSANGASLRTGDLFASGTVSGPSHHQRGSLLELSWGGAVEVALDDGATRTFLEDGDEVVLRATGPGGLRLGECRGVVLPARPR